MTEDQPRRTRMDRGLDRGFALGRRLADWGRRLVRNPIRLLTTGLCIVLLAVALPLLIGGGTRLRTSWNEWRHDRAVGRDWLRATGSLTEVRETDGLRLRLTYFDRSGDLQRAEVQVDASGARWIKSEMPIRYDPTRPSQVDLVGVAEANSLGGALVAGAAIGAGFAALILAIGIWRRRRVLAETRHPVTVLRVPLALSGAVLALGLAAWAVGTVQLRGWTGVADRLGHQLSIAFGDMLGVFVPVVAFVVGCLLTAWLARHRDSRTHTGILASVHRVIDRAANFVPSPEDLQAVTPPEEPAPAAVATADAGADADGADAAPAGEPGRSELGDDLVGEPRQ